MSQRVAIKCCGAGIATSPRVPDRLIRSLVLRQIATGLYFQGGASWTSNSEEALVYRDVEAAMEAAYTSCVTGLELTIFLFDDPRYTIRLRLDEGFGKPPRSGPGWFIQERRTRFEPGGKSLN